MELFLEFVSQQWVLVTALLVVAFMLFFHESRKSGPSLSPQQAINMFNSQEGVFLDLRDTADYKGGHIVDALHIPAAKLESRLAELEKNRSKHMMFRMAFFCVCENGLVKAL